MRSSATVILRSGARARTLQCLTSTWNAGSQFAMLANIGEWLQKCELAKTRSRTLSMCVGLRTSL